MNKFSRLEGQFEIGPGYCQEAVGHVLQQRQGGELRLIAAGGRKITPGEKIYKLTSFYRLTYIYCSTWGVGFSIWYG